MTSRYVVYSLDVPNYFPIRFSSAATRNILGVSTPYVIDPADLHGSQKIPMKTTASLPTGARSEVLSWLFPLGTRITCRIDDG